MILKRVKRQEEIIIKACLGFGNIISDSLIEPDTYYLEKNGLNVKQEIIKKQQWRYATNYETGETTKIAISETKANNKKINEYEMMKLSKLIKMIESLFEKPQQIAWSIEGENFYILEAKPILIKEKQQKVIEEKQTEEPTIINEERIIEEDNA